MDLRLSHCSQFVHDQETALAFYHDVLGLEVRADIALGEGRWLTVGPPAQPDIEIMIETPNLGHAPDDEAALLALMAKHVLNTLIFVVEDCDATYQTVRSAGAEVIQEPTDQPYGVRDCALRDPSGNQVRFSQSRRTLQDQPRAAPAPDDEA